MDAAKKPNKLHWSRAKVLQYSQERKYGIPFGELSKMRLALFDWLLIIFAVVAAIALFTIGAIVEGVVIAVLMIIAVALHHSLGNFSGRIL